MMSKTIKVARVGDIWRDCLDGTDIVIENKSHANKFNDNMKRRHNRYFYRGRNGE